jgi:hypothetical protein
MAPMSRVVYVVYKVIIRITNETFSELAEQFIADIGSNVKVECSGNRRKDWAEMDDAVLGLPCIGVLDSFNYKFICLENIQRASEETNVTSPQTIASANAFEVLMSANRKLRLPEKKTNRYVKLSIDQ